jgi:hypothetical protein
MLPPSFEPFVKAAPFCVMARAALESLFCPERLDELFGRTARRQYTRKLLFSQLVQLMTAVVLRQQPSVHAAYKNRVGDITVSDQAVYDKLDHLELGVSAALVRDSAHRITPVIDALAARLDPWVEGRRVKILDGNAPAATQRRLAELRDTWDAPLPGKALAVLDQQTGLCTDVFLTPDGHAQERSLLGDVLDTVDRDDLWIADRNFCTLGFLFGLGDLQAAFVIRQHGNLEGRLLEARRPAGRSETGEVYEQDIGVDYQGQTRVFRRVTIELDRPTRDGDRVIHILTNLPEEKADALRVAELYRRRWTIETLFYEVTVTLDCEPHTLGYPRAALFALCLALVASNAVALIKASVRSARGADAVEELSVYYVALEISRTHAGMMVALPEQSWEFLREVPADGLAALLRRLAGGVDLTRYRKAKRGPKKPPTARKPYNNGGHASTHKLLQKRGN